MKATSAEDSVAHSVVTGLYLRTKALHVEAERSGIIQDLLRGNASREGYILFMRNLLPAYQAMEAGLERHSSSPALSELSSYRLNRTATIEADLNALCGQGWSRNISVLDAGKTYARRIAKAAEGDGTRLIAHAYTRYLGDLSGGLILHKLLARSLGLQPSQLTFYSFPQFSDLAALKSGYRKALDDAGSSASNTEAIVEEGAAAFSLNIDLSWAVKNAATPKQPASSLAS